MVISKEQAITNFQKLGVLNQGEEIITLHECRFRRLTANRWGKFNCFLAFLTNKRFILVNNQIQSVIQSWELDKILSIDERRIKGIVRRKLSSIFSILYEMEIIIFLIVSDERNQEDAEDFFNSVVEAKEKLGKISSVVMPDKVEKVIVEIHQEKKEDAIEILQKRLARGEITLDEFHRIVQRL